MLDLRKHVEGLVWELDKQVAVNHTHCAAGTDTRQRLYLKAVDTYGKWIGYCHNCGESGVAASKGVVEDIYSLLDEGRKAPSTLGPMSGTTYLLDRWDASSTTIQVLPKLWLQKWHLDEVDFPRIPVRCSSTGNLLFRYGSSSLQQRSFGAAGSPKYITLQAADDVSWACYGALEEAHTVVLTEDIISAYRFDRDVSAPYFTQQIAVVALLGTNLPDVLLAKLAGKDIVIWLDGDVAGNSAKVKVAKAAAQVAQNVYVSPTTLPSPKELSPTELRSVSVSNKFKPYE